MARAHFQRSGVKEIRTPLLEATDLFARGIGKATDVVGKEMYTFLDHGDRSCTLRPEGTTSVVRSAIQHGLLSQGTQQLRLRAPYFAMSIPRLEVNVGFIKSGVNFLAQVAPAAIWK